MAKRAAMVDRRDLRSGLAAWQAGDTGPLLCALGFERVEFRVPAEAHADFGLTSEPVRVLEIAGRHNDFFVFRVILRGSLEPAAIQRTAAALYRHNPIRRSLLLFEAEGDSRLLFASWGVGPGPFRLTRLTVDALAPRASELDILGGLAVDGRITASELALAHARALDRELITRRFYHEFRAHRADLAEALQGIPEGRRQDRLDLALIMLSRLLFLYFIQRKGWLGGDRSYLLRLFETASDDGVPFFTRRLQPLFFSALNRPPRERGRLAKQLGELPYLNGGLFERETLELKYPSLDVPDQCIAAVLHDLLEKYQFTLREDQASDTDVAVDPEMLGRVFEGLMTGPVRESTGTFYTPRALVDQLVDGALAAHLARSAGCHVSRVENLLAGQAVDLPEPLCEDLLTRVRSLRILDPAVGSGAFLLAALHRLETLRETLAGPLSDPLSRFTRRQQIIRRSLFGVDINEAAVRLCELRLWLALAVDLEVQCIADVPALPNLDLNIRQGDALVDPLDFVARLGLPAGPVLVARWRRQVARLETRRDHYFNSVGRKKRRLHKSLRQAESELACNFLTSVARAIDARRRDLRATANSRDLFGQRAGLDRAQRKLASQLKQRRKEVALLLRRVRDLKELPFFSYTIHFSTPEAPTAAFDIVLGNPPWVRTHRWSGASRQRLKERFRFLQEAGWRTGSRWAGAGRGFGAQLDLSALFLERSLDLLGDHGTLGFLLPAKLLRSLSAGAVRRSLVTDHHILRVEDCSLAPTPLFQATTYPVSILLSHARPAGSHRVAVTVHDRWGEVLSFAAAQNDLPLHSTDLESPWVLAPPPVRRIFERMRGVAPPLGAQEHRRPSRGLFTSANDVFVGELIGDGSNADCARLRVADSEVEIEKRLLRPAVRGVDLEAWRFSPSRSIVWPYDNHGHILFELPPAARAHFECFEARLKNRVDLRSGQPYWTLFRLHPRKWSQRVAWRDIARAPAAVLLPPDVGFLNRRSPVISLNTVYHIAAASLEDGHFIAAVLNSTVARAYLRAIAERAAGGYFRFLGWTVALLPVPERPDAATARLCVRLSRHAHREGRLSAQGQRSLDGAVARLYGLSHGDLEALRSFDRRLG